jgi:hypothetical protein
MFQTRSSKIDLQVLAISIIGRNKQDSLTGTCKIYNWHGISKIDLKVLAISMIGRNKQD